MKIDKLHVVLLFISVAFGTVAVVQSRAAAKADLVATSHRKVSEAAFVDSAYRGAERLAQSTQQEPEAIVVERLRQRRAFNVDSLSPTEQMYFRAAEAKATYTIGQWAAPDSAENGFTR